MQTGCPGEQFVGKFFLKKYKTFQYFPILSENISAFWRKNFGRVVENAIWVSRRTFWGQTISGKNICSFWSFLDFEAFFWELWSNHFSTVVLTADYLSRGGVWAEVFFLGKTIFCHFRILSKNFWDFWQEIAKIAVYVSRGTIVECFLENFHFYDFPNLSEELSSCWQKNFGRLVKSAIWVSRGTFLGETTFLKKYMYFLMVFGLRAIFIELWREYFSTVVRIEFCVSRGRVWTKIYFFENV